jgi:hypothetical protein
VWTRVHDLPDFVYFSHEIHVNKGVGCKTCHGPIDEMPLTYQHATLQMEWCLDCHRNTDAVLRPREQVFNMAYQPPTPATPVNFEGKTYTKQTGEGSLGEAIHKSYHVRKGFELQSCETCHR